MCRFVFTHQHIRLSRWGCPPGRPRGCRPRRRRSRSGKMNEGVSTSVPKMLWCRIINMCASLTPERYPCEKLNVPMLKKQSFEFPRLSPEVFASKSRVRLLTALHERAARRLPSSLLVYTRADVITAQRPSTTKVANTCNLNLAAHQSLRVN